MWRRILLFALLLAAWPTFAKEASDSWVEVRSPHFLVLTNASEKQARHVAGQFERMREVFRAAFPKTVVDPASPITVIALKNKQDFQSLEPESYLAKGQLELAGLFLRTPEKNYVLLRLDAQGEHPYATVYHEYTHLLLSDVEDWLPLWLNEGLAEFFQNTEIHEKEAQLGGPSSEDILYLRQNKLLPLPTLFAVDAKSPYYHEEQKGSAFYAESWALTHFLQITDNMMHTHRLADYVDIVSKHVDPVVAAERAFGDLHQLQKALETYLSLPAFRYFRVPTTVAVNEAAFEAKAVPIPAADAVRADFLAYNNRGNDARALLDTILKDDPKSASAHETMGYLEFRAGNLEAARTWYEQAVQLDSQSYLAHYYFAAISMQNGSTTRPEDIESSLKTAIKLNSKFAPAYDALATFYGNRHERLDEAHMLALRATVLDPANLGYRLNTAAVLEQQNRNADALRVLTNAAGLAKTPEEAAAVESRVMALKQYQAEQDKATEASRQAEVRAREASRLTVISANSGAPKHPTEAPSGPKYVAKGVIKSVECTDPSVLELKVTGGPKDISLYSNNYFAITYAATNYTPEGDIQPCKDLEGMKASVQYSATSDKTVDGQILSVELSK